MKITKDIIDQVGDVKSHVLRDIKSFLENCNRFFFNERELQMHLAIYLKQSKYNNGNYKYDYVDVEYHIPRDFKPEIDKAYPWNTNMLSYDIMVSRAGEFVPIEIKYKLKDVDCKLTRCGEYGEESSGAGATRTISDQGARDLGCYGFWKDVKRVEILRDSFKSVNGGFVLFLTNDSDYVNLPTNKDVSYYNFRIKQGSVISGNLEWQNHPKMEKDYPSFKINGCYDIDWRNLNINDNTKGINNVDLHALLLEI